MITNHIESNSRHPNADNPTLRLGIRKVTRQNFSHIVTLPKVFTRSCLGRNMEVELTLEGGRLILTPVSKNNKKEGQRD